MRVLLVSHTCMSRTMGQPKLYCLAAYRDLELTALVPDRMLTYGQWQEAELPQNPPFRFVAGHTRWRSIFKQWYLLHYPNSLGRLLVETQPDIVDIWEEPWGLVTAQTIWLTKLLCPQAKIIVETEQNIFKHLPPPFTQFQKYSLANADWMIARTEEAKDVLRRKGYHKSVGVVPNAVDCTAFTPQPPEQRLRLRQKFGWGSPDEFLIGYVGRLVPEKGLLDAVEALNKLPKNARLIFVGQGPQRGDLERRAQVLGLVERVVFAGQKPLTELPEVMNALDVLVLPSRTTATWKEQFGRVLIEAGACALPVVGSDSGAIPAVTAEAGLIFPEGNVTEFAACLRRLQDDAGLRQRLGEIGQARAEQLFSWRRVAAQMHAIYEETTANVPLQTSAQPYLASANG